MQAFKSTLPDIPDRTVGVGAWNSGPQIPPWDIMAGAGGILIRSKEAACQPTNQQ